MPPYSLPTREDDPVHVVRTIGRLAQMIIELREEYVRDMRTDTLDQFERRLEELCALREALHERRQQQEAESESRLDE